jgi:hypothetical protein
MASVIAFVVIIDVALLKLSRHYSQNSLGLTTSLSMWLKLYLFMRPMARLNPERGL